MRTLAVLPLLLAFGACRSPRYFAPREQIAATGADGSPAAQYMVPPAAAGMPATAEVRVWSRGAKARFAEDDREVVELHVGFELENNGDQALQLDLGTVVVEELSIEGVLQAPLPPLRIDGDGTAPPGRTARVDLWFQPQAARPHDIDGFVVRFLVREGEREALKQVTPFGPWTWASAPDPYWSGWGWSYGYGCYGFHGHWH